MMIAMIHSRLHAKGGTQRQFLSTAHALQKLGHHVTVYTLAYSKEHCFQDLLEGLRVVPLQGYHPALQKSKVSLLRFFNYFLYSRNESRAAQALARLIDPYTEILHPYDRISYRVAAFYKKKIRNIPSVIMMDDVHTKLWTFWRKQQLHPGLHLPFRRKLFYQLVDWYEVRKFIRPHERIIVLDDRTKQWVGNYFKREARVIRSGLDLEKFHFVPRSLIYASSITLLSTGAFFLHRRYEDTIHAVALLKKKGIDVSFSIVGDFQSPEYSPYYRTLLALCRTLGVAEHVCFLGRISEEELLSLYRNAAVYISSNHLQSWGLSVFEAMACGLPVIVSKSSGAAEVLTDRENALLIDPKSPEVIVKAVEEILGSQKLYVRLSNVGRSFVEQHITWKKTAEELVSVFEHARRES